MVRYHKFLHKELTVPIEGPKRPPSVGDPRGARQPLGLSFYVPTLPFVFILYSGPWIPSGEDGLFRGVTHIRMGMGATEHPPNFDLRTSIRV